MRSFVGCLVALLLAAPVQALKPYIFSSRSKYANSDNSFAGSHLRDAVFKVVFDEPVVTAPTTQMFSVGADNGVSLSLLSVTAVDNRQWTFRLSVGRNSKPPGNEIVTATLQMFGGVAFTATGDANIISDTYTITYASRYPPPTVSWSSDAATGKTTTAQVVFVRDSFVQGAGANDYSYPLETKNYDSFGTQQTVDTGISVLTNTLWEFDTYDTPAGSKVCLEWTGQIADMYGNFLDNSLAFVQNFCTDIPDCGQWSAWSECTYSGCRPQPADSSGNVRSRVRPGAAGCAQSLEEVEVCITPSTLPICKADIFSGETGTECAGQCQAGKQPSGCYCGATESGQDCAITGTCCQSYYASCIPDVDTDPYYYYKYSQCWKPYTCTSKCGTVSNTQEYDCTFTIADESIVRSYDYGCSCQSDCANVNGVDTCCGGATAYAQECPAP
jgi:hypothetical protein